MTDKKCDGNCCDSFFKDYDDVEDDYEIQRLKDIIKICEFLIQTKEHRKDKRETFKKLFEEEEPDTDKEVPFHVFKYKYPKRWIYPNTPYWDQIWF